MAQRPHLAPLRTVSAQGLVDIRHPVPDLQTMQGAYTKNVERLEQSAEELSQGGSDIGEEIKKMKQEQDRLSRRSSLASGYGSQREGRTISAVLQTRSRNASTSSYTNSIVDLNAQARWGGYSPGGYITSPSASVSRVSSFHRPSGLPEPLQEGRPLDSPLASPSPMASPGGSVCFPIARRPSQQSLAPTQEETDMEEKEKERPQTARAGQEADLDGDWGTVGPEYPRNEAPDNGRHEEQEHDKLQREDFERLYDQAAEHRPATPPERPQTADTYRQAQDLFRDFDGVHFSPTHNEFVELDQNGNEVGRMTSAEFQQHLLQQQQRANRTVRPMSYGHPPPPREGMVFYPAPVPRMLNLPKRLSQLPAANVQSQRRSQVMSQMLPPPPQQQQEHPAARQSAQWLPQIGNLDFEAEHKHNSAGSPRASNELDDGASWGEGRESNKQTGGLRSDSPPLDVNASPTKSSPRKQRHSMMNLARERVSMANMPPQLRATMFFEQPRVRQEFEVKSASAVATLDSILAASVNAPVNSFTDHPYAGPVGEEVYGKDRTSKRSTTLIDFAKSNTIVEEDERKSRAVSSGTMGGDKTKQQRRGSIVSMLTDFGMPSTGKKLKKRNSKMSLATDMMDLAHGEDEQKTEREAALRALENDARSVRESGDVTPEEEDYEEQQFEEQHPFYTQPTTLLAELQIRKAQLKSRSRTAANSFPNGMHSTLLQLDAVKQIENKKRKNHRTRLAWEDANAEEEHADEDEDEDVPLGVLYPAVDGKRGADKAAPSDWDRPVGLMERRELEDNEPLSRRRNRLLGVNPEEALRLERLWQRQQEAERRAAAAAEADAEARAGAEARQGAAAAAAAAAVEPTEEDGDEPLAERRRRIQRKAALDAALGGVNEGSAFTDDLLSQFGGLIGDEAKAADNKDKTSEDKDEPRAPTPTATQILSAASAGPTTEPTASSANQEPDVEPAEETLGQRRARLQREREAQAQAQGTAPDKTAHRPAMRSSVSLANLLSVHPAGAPEAKSATSRREPQAGTLLYANSQAEQEAKRKLREQNARSASFQHLPTSSHSTPTVLDSPFGGIGLAGQDRGLARMHSTPGSVLGMPYTGAQAAPMMCYGQGVAGYPQFAQPTAAYPVGGVGVPPMAGYPGSSMGMYGQSQMYPSMGMQQHMVGGGVGVGGGMSAEFAQEMPMNRRQRELIDRWRMSVAQ